MAEAKLWVLIDSDEDITEVFDTENELEEYLKEEGYDAGMVQDVRVFEVAQEYRVNADTNFELEKV